MSGIAADYDIQRKRTVDYVKKHQISELFAHLLQLVVYNSPENPREFLLSEIRKMRSQGKSTSLFTEDDFGTMFDLIDVTKQKHVSVDQLRNACKNLAAAAGQDGGITEAQEKAIQAAANEKGQVGPDAFKSVLALLLSTKNHWST
jgi:hypothetical protein